MIENLEYLEGITSLAFPVKGPSGLPLANSDDIAVKILIDEDEDYIGYLSLTDLINSLSQSNLNLLQKISELELINTDLTSRIETLEATDFTVDNDDSTQYPDIF